MVSKAIENSQKRVEGHNFEIRKQLLDFDNVMNQQREVVYSRRKEIMFAETLDDQVDEFVQELLDVELAPVLAMKEVDEETRAETRSRLDELFNFSRFKAFESGLPDMDQAQQWLDEIWTQLRTMAGEPYQEILRYFLLDSLDRNWKEHLLSMDQLRDGIGLRGYGQKDPKQEYKREGFAMFQETLYTVCENAIRALTHLRIRERVEESEFKHEDTSKLNYAGSESSGAAKPAQQPVVKDAKVGRNDPCPCGSGKKYKKCCGK
ncbi:MAG: SEC-C domain-containing protein [Proteobacteria bacterium]|nr:SEC-C domain-containing protein [Pseudomonadota bacterium]